MTLVGNYGRTIFRDDKTGRTIFTFNTKDVRPNTVTCLGSCQQYPSDMPLKIDGEFKKEQFYFTKCFPYINNREKMIAFLSGKTFKGIGEKTAEKICDFVKGNIFDFVQEEDAECQLSEEFSPIIAKEVVSKISEYGRVNLIYDLIQQYGGSISAALKISSLATLKEFSADVYKIGAMGGLSFGTCDGVAKSLGYLSYDNRRISAILARAVSKASSDGNIYTDIKTLVNKANYLCKSSAYEDEVPPPVLLLAAYNNKRYTIQEDKGSVRYYSTFLLNCENTIANGILKLSASSRNLPFEDAMIDEIENECGIKYSAGQKKAFELLKTTGVKILTGGPGTGKSTVVKGIIKAIKKMFPEEQPLLCAPTGRAAQRLKEVTGEESFTIHRALNLAPYDEEYADITPIESKFIIVDEASMIDTVLLQYLISAVSPSSFILFCGDTEQLPAVGPGNVLKDMIASNKIDVVVLDVIYRCLKDSLISYNAYNIRSGITKIEEGKDFHYFAFDSEEDVKKKVEEIVREKHDKKHPFRLQVLAPVKDGEIGVKNLNKVLQNICNEDTGKSTVYDFFKYKVSDKIIMTKNNYKDGYLNGDVGIVKDIIDNTMTVLLGDGKEVVLSTKNLDDVAPAYALTVHKSQGSEFSRVIVVLSNSCPRMLQRNLLYTAITRAKDEVYVVAQKGAYEAAVNNVKLLKRNTSLKEKIEKGDFIYG